MKTIQKKKPNQKLNQMPTSDYPENSEKYQNSLGKTIDQGRISF